jgi:phosphate-selective porin OprO and OprP
MNGIRLAMGVAMVGAALIGSRAAFAADAATNKLEELDQKVSALERRLQAAEANTAAKAPNAAVVTAGKDGFLVSSADRAFQLRIRGYVQADGRFYLNDRQDKSVDTFLLRRVRPTLDLRMYDDFLLRFQPDFGGSSPTTQDAYLDYLATPALNFRAGKFKVPFGLEFLQTDSDMFFAERGLPTQLVPNRDVGFQVYGGMASGTVTYAVGVFDGTVDGGNTDLDNNDDKDFAARLFVHPFRLTGIEVLRNFGVGVAGTLGDEQGTASSSSLPAFKTSGQQTFFSYKNSTNANGTAFADGRHERLEPQVYCYVGPIGMLAEYVKSSQDVSDGTHEATLDNTAWQVQAGWVLTGEKASYNDVTPRANFAPSKGTWGAFELVGRYGELTVDDAAFSTFADPAKSASTAKTWAAGVNWYLNRSLKLMLDYDQTSFEGGAAKGADRPDEELLLCRAQISF